ncbi:MAG: hypothetical protein ACODAU_10750 [Myxococcota bacterium]
MRYERAVGHAGLLAEVLQVLQRNLDDERRHRSWIEQKIRQM